MSDLTAIVLAAGAGTRMKSQTAKVLHRIGGRSMVGHVLTAVAAIDPDQVVAVVGHQRDQVQPHIAQIAPATLFATQEEQLGTGHAVQMAVAALPRLTGTVLVVYADTPLLTGESLTALLDHHRASDAAVTVLTGVVADPTGYGRIVRDQQGAVSAIVEQKDADPEQLAITEINSGIFAFDADFLSAALPRLGNDNAAGEFYLTDLVGLAVADQIGVDGFRLADVMQTEGANDRVQLAVLGRELNRRVLVGWMRAGVTVVDPDTTWVDVTVTLGSDVTLAPSTLLYGATSVGDRAQIGPFVILTDAVVANDEVVPPFTCWSPGA